MRPGRVKQPPLPSETPVVADIARLRMLAQVAEQVGEGVGVADNDGTFIYVNPTFAAQHAATVTELTGAHLADFYTPENLLTQVQPIIAAALRDGVGRGEATRLRRDGTEFPARITLSVLLDETGKLLGRVVCVQDITEQRRLELQLRQAALHDQLTGLANRRLLHDRAEHALVRADRHAGSPAAVFLDLDDFKVVNDTHGHEVGDQVLAAVATRLQACIRAGDTAARVGGDEFVLLLEDLVRPEEADIVVQRCRRSLDLPVESACGPVTVTASFGVHHATAADDYDSLLACADAAMYRAKAERTAADVNNPTAPTRPRPDPPTRD